MALHIILTTRIVTTMNYNKSKQKEYLDIHDVIDTVLNIQQECAGGVPGAGVMEHDHQVDVATSSWARGDMTLGYRRSQVITCAVPPYTHHTTNCMSCIVQCKMFLTDRL